MLVWIIAAAVTVAVVMALLAPLRRQRESLPRAEYDLSIYRAQLAELERDAAAGQIGAAERDAAKLEVERRMLAAAAAPEAPAATGTGLRDAALVAIAVTVPAGALLLYAVLGDPAAPGQPYADRQAVQALAEAQRALGGGSGAAGPDADMSTLVLRLAERLKANPADGQGWALLGRSYLSIGRPAEAAAAFEEAARRLPDQPELHSQRGEALAAAANGMVTPAAVAAFELAVRGDPADPRARFFLALAKSQSGDLQGALADWQALERASPADAPWLDPLRERIADMARRLGQPVPPRAAAAAPAAPPPSPPSSSVPPASAAPVRGPTAADVAAAQSMLPADRAAMIRGMVDGLAARLEQQPGDLDGWLRLARARLVLGEPVKARDAFQKAAALKPDDVAIRREHARAAVAAAPSEEPVAPEVADAMAQLLRLDGGDPDALWYGGLARAQAGDASGARALLGQLLPLLPAGSERSRAVQQRLKDLGG